MEKILGTPPLDVSPSLSRFLRYIVEETLAGRTAGLRELALGQNVFDRGDTFNPRVDPIVRVQARNLRSRLAQYYAGPGVDDPITIELPKGTYIPVLMARTPGIEGSSPAPPPETPPPEPGPQPSTSKLSSRATLGLVLPLVVLAAGALWLLRPHPPAQAGAHHRPDPAAQNLYIRGRYLMDRMTEPALREAADCLTRAAARDPLFAAAQAGVADAYNLLAQYGYIPPSEGMERARRAARQAIAIDPGLAEGHVSLGGIIEAYDWDWKAAEREYRRALSLNPALAGAHLWYGAFLRDQGRLREALPELRRAAEIEPFSALISVNLAHALILEGDYETAAEQARRAAEISPDLTSASVILSNAYRAASKVAESDAVLARALPVAAPNPHGIALLAVAFTQQGKREEGTRLMRRLEELSHERYVSPFDLGTVALTLGDEDRALALFEEALRQRSSGLVILRNSKDLSLHSSPRFTSILDKIHCQC
jgi:tetratricopeptide (TPR) repeat protein